MRCSHFYIVIGVTLVFVVLLIAIVNLEPRARVHGPVDLMVAQEVNSLWSQESRWLYRYTCLLLIYAQIMAMVFAHALLQDRRSGKRSISCWMATGLAVVMVLGGTLFPSMANLNTSHTTQLTVILLIVSSIANALVFGCWFLVGKEGKVEELAP